jgi:hypothetical protein
MYVATVNSFDVDNRYQRLYNSRGAFIWLKYLGNLSSLNLDLILR